MRADSPSERKCTVADSPDHDGEDKAAGEAKLADHSAPVNGPPEAARRDRWPTKTLVMSRGRRTANRVIGRLARLGMVPHTYQMTTVGRKTGQLHSTPVSLVEHGGQRWLVAPYGPVAWVLNARAAGRVTLARRRRTADYAVDELSFAEAGPILRDYLQFAGATKEFFVAKKNSPVEEFVQEAGRHPVFSLTPMSD
jgi:deazaflavin-dependent oxidoreductase (nitroreductase family)